MHVLNILKRNSDKFATNFISKDWGYISSVIFSGFHPVEKHRVLLLINIDSDDEAKIAQDVNKISSYFLYPRNISYFQFKRIYKNNTYIILANNSKFFQEFFENGFIEPTIRMLIYTRQSSFCFWDETLDEAQLSSLREEQGIYHGLTILSRRKAFYDCTTFAMSEHHPSPTAYYFHILKDLQKFIEVFPTIAPQLIKKATRKLLKTEALRQDVSRKYFFLPKRSARFYIGEDVKNYITTYEALCVQLAQEGKSHKEIGSILSMASSTVKTHLNRLKTRTGLTLQEISLQSFQTYKNTKNAINLENGLEKCKLRKNKNHKND